ncbi:major facilitator superfamily domain-containing protein [Collybia nuda]|uniref:Major facilitator superfamily domain-containing protein n=1 Tax=Collybia nuda TaxID=64659 RepID=A0A9P6CPJ2_9AGAR|nr:major facilitator superfamily domain-containing protein [Collybia nuda]
MTVAPRIEVFTQLSCNRLHGHYEYNHTRDSLFQAPVNFTRYSSAVPFYFSLDPLGPHIDPYYIDLIKPNAVPFSPANESSDHNGSDEDEEDPRRLPSARCLGNPAVQAGAARLQVIMITTMGFLSALTTGWWGHFGERHGRTKVLAVSTLGLFLTDLIFILVSTPSSPLSSHGHKLLFVAPVIEGLLGGWSTLQSATSAYLSDCTSSGSRASIFSRFSGVFYIGLSVGPAIGGYLIRNPIWSSPSDEKALTVTTVFWVAIICSFINFILVLFVFPESLDKVKLQQAALEFQASGNGKGKAMVDDIEEDEGGVTGEGSGTGNDQDRVHAPRRGKRGIIRGFLRPLALFMPVVVMEGGLRKRRDWSLTFLGAALFGSMLSNGVHQVKYLYAEHVYEWGAEQLSYYISFIGGARAVFLLFLLPAFKPTRSTQKPQTNTGNAPAATETHGKKLKPTKAHLAREISFDLFLTRCSLVIDIISNTFVVLAPTPTFHMHSMTRNIPTSHSKQESQALFVLATSLSSLGSGAVPAIQSLALCILQVRALDAEAAGIPGKETGVGRLFGALAVLQTVGQMIIGPMLFGLVFSGTVAAYPKTVFMMAGAILVCSLTMTMLVRGPVIPRPTGPVIRGKGKKKSRDVERGRSRVSKDLRGGATRYYGSMDSSMAGSSTA